MKSNIWQRQGWIVAAGGAALVAGLALIAVWWQSSSPARQEPQTVWAELVAAADNRLRVRLIPAPSGAPRTLRAPANEKRLTIILTPTTQLTADYFVGDVVNGERVYAQPLRLDKLRPGIHLRLTLVPARGGQWEARAVSWPQSIRPSAQTATPAPNTKIPPPINPP